MQTEAQVVATEVERVEKRLPELYDLEDTLFSMIDKSASAIPVSNRAMRVPLKLRPGGRFGMYNPDNGPLGLGSGPTYDKAVVTVNHFRHNIQWTKLTEYATDSDRKAIVNAYQDLIASHMPEFRRATNALMMTSGNGVLGTVTSVSTTAGVDTVTCTTDGYGVKLLRYDQAVNIYDATLTTNRTAAAERVITFYDLPNNQFKIASVTGMITGDKIVISGAQGASPSSLLGIPYHNSNASTGTWLGFDRGATPEIRANRVNAAGALALPFARLARNKIGDRIGMEALKNKGVKAFMHPCQKQAYEGLGQLVSIIQKTSNEEGLDLYFGDSMQMAGAPITEQYMWDKTRIDFLAMKVFGRAVMYDVKYHEVGGRKVFELRGPDGSVMTSQIQHLVTGWQLFADQPPALSYIDALTIPPGY